MESVSLRSPAPPASVPAAPAPAEAPLEGEVLPVGMDLLPYAGGTVPPPPKNRTDQLFSDFPASAPPPPVSEAQSATPFDLPPPLRPFPGSRATCRGLPALVPPGEDLVDPLRATTVGGEADTKSKADNLGETETGPSFVEQAAAALDAALPVPGAFGKLKFASRIPLSNLALGGLYLNPIVSLEAQRADSGKFETSMTLDVGVLFEAGGGASPALIKMAAHIRAGARGIVEIVGDSAHEVFSEFLLFLRTVLENACNAAGIPGEYTEILAEMLLSGQDRSKIIANMDDDDRVDMSIGVGVEAGFEGKLKLGGLNLDSEYTFEHSQDYTKRMQAARDRPGQLDTKELVKHTTSFAFQLTNPPLSAEPTLTAVSGERGMEEFELELFATTKPDFGEMKEVGSFAAEWGAETLGELIRMLRGAAKGTEQSATREIVAIVGSFDPTTEALKYTSVGKQLNKAAQAERWGGESGHDLEFGIELDLSWERGKGGSFTFVVTAENSFQLGSDRTPMQFEVRTGEPILRVAQEFGADRIANDP